MNFIKTAFVTSALLVATSAHSIIIQFGDDVSFEYDETTLFGLGTVVGNNIFFTPDAFVAESLDGAGLSTLTDNLNIDVVVTTQGFTLTDFLLIENGDYRLKGSGADVDADALFIVTSNTSLFGCGGGGFSLCQDGFIADADPLIDTNGDLEGWSLGGSLDLADTIGWGSDTSVNINLQNNILAETSANGEIAFIQKKFGAIGITINTVPVPGAVWLFGSGLIMLIGFSRRSKS